jgi:hypothetical protein
VLGSGSDSNLGDNTYKRVVDFFNAMNDNECVPA